MANGLLDYLSGFGSTPPEYLGGLLGQEAVDKLKGRAATTGIANAVLGYLAAPKNQNLGLGRIIGSSLQAGMQGAQGVYDNATQDYLAQQRIGEMQRKQAQQTQLQGMLANITDPNERLAAELAPEQYVAAKFKPQKSFNILTPEQTTAYGLPTDKGQRYQMTESGVSLISGTETKENPATNLEKLQTYRDTLFKANPNDPRIKSVDAAINKETNFAPAIQVNYGAPQAGVDANGNPVFFQPSKTGGAPQIVQGVAPLREEKAPTESQAKASAFGSQMQSASQEFEQLQKEGFTPSATTSQAQVELAGTPLRVFADPLAQRAQQSQAQWSEAYLRYKTGAAATEGEVKRNIDTYFPKIGETDAKVIEQKARMRKQAEQDVLKSAKPSTQQNAKFTVKDQQALDWAKQNPNDPRASAIKQKLGVK
jgi:hypothetical protein